MLEKVFLILTVVLAIISISTTKLRRAVIYLGLFSLVISFTYLLYSAPDVAIAEAIIGSALSTILYLVALKKFQVFTIYYTNYDYNEINYDHVTVRRGQILKDIEKFYVDREMEPQIIYTTENFKHILKTKNYDLLIYQKHSDFYIYGFEKDYQLDAIEGYFMNEDHGNLDINIIRCKEGEYNDA
ncbi:DUF4040 domain-containing protein [Alkalibaculum sp. M08DMB]|uniref:DUF4040 domain-containing protein n=1 Tax=Alkalibaculum sporogenes TaxID=2655001 RepID=A0A6A7K8B6_9FIRM|nr:DUF4040 domain-containing protein [Alkalibaculum sporogenes]MPW25749.1 DUF4040 domain-containing protein [Alkalibaculum sporogenes]